MVPINDDMSWSNYVKAVFNGTDWNCLEVYVQAEKRSSAEAVSSEVELMDSEPPDVQRQDAPPPDPAHGASLFTPSMVNTFAPTVHSLRARLRKPRTNTRTYAAKGGAEVQFGQYHTGASEPADTTIYPLIGLYDEDHRARALVSGKNLTELNPRNREPLRFDKRYECYLRAAGLIGLANISRAGLPSIDRALVSALVDRWRPETHTFHMPCGELTITLQDVAMILGLPIAGRAVTSNQTESHSELYQRYLGKMPPSDKTRHGLKVAWVRAEFNNCPEDADEETVKQHARAYILSLVGGLLFPDASGDRYNAYPFPLIADLENIGSYSWGSATLAYLYRAMCDACRRQSDQGNLTGCLLLLQLWSWERFPIGRPDMVKLKYPNVEELEDERDRPAVGLRWVVGVCTYRSAPARCYEHFTNEFDLLTDDQVVWSPYREERVEKLQLAPICTQDSHLWLTQAPLVFFFMVEVYTPERVMRQFGLHQECPPPYRDTSMELHWCRRGRVHNDWADKHKSFVDMWEVKEQHVIKEERPYNPANYMDYLRWYRRSTRIRLCTPRISTGNQAGASGPSAIADPEDSLRASRLRYTPRAHLIHAVTDKLTILAKEATSQKGCSRGECNAFIELVTRTCVELVGELGGSSLCDIAATVPCSLTAPTIAAEPEVEHQRDNEDGITDPMLPDQETEPGPDSERRTRSQVGHTQVDGTVHTNSPPGKRKRGRPGPR
ncbi:serine/threonine-protein phosphatase 7 long form homolog [Lolium rigidum]|uniref:serine/threonine-protein phosphatase 7 long form homolog n=1 Tax=Lolium rigidum TaxID=89674 RepID=UPI001F5E0ACC|nr:serine/threonine-protein phosphatase 7 long form homolog [Lolium rigidum]